MINRMKSYGLNDEDKQIEQQVIEQIVASNGYDTSIVKHLNKPGQKVTAATTKISGPNLQILGRKQGPLVSFSRKHK
jgi:hypothetical protein